MCLCLQTREKHKAHMILVLGPVLRRNQSQSLVKVFAQANIHHSSPREGSGQEHEHEDREDSFTNMNTERKDRTNARAHGRVAWINARRYARRLLSVCVKSVGSSFTSSFSCSIVSASLKKLSGGGNEESEASLLQRVD